ncbi:MAG: LysM peptidoglycan-binding domain-containing protein [Weeksellaceae bacterium]
MEIKLSSATIVLMKDQPQTIEYQDLIQEKLEAHRTHMIIGSLVLVLSIAGFAYLTLQSKTIYADGKLRVKAPPITETAPIQKAIQENGQISAISSGQVTYKEKTYTVQLGDSLANIAQQAYGDSNAWVKIAEANNLLDNPDALEAGMKLIIPR